MLRRENNGMFEHACQLFLSSYDHEKEVRQNWEGKEVLGTKEHKYLGLKTGSNKHNYNY